MTVNPNAIMVLIYLLTANALIKEHLRLFIVAASNTKYVSDTIGRCDIIKVSSEKLCNKKLPSQNITFPQWLNGSFYKGQWTRLFAQSELCKQTHIKYTHVWNLKS